MKEIRYNKSIVRIRGTYDLEKLKKDTATFMKKVERSKNQNGNKNKTRAVS